MRYGRYLFFVSVAIGSVFIQPQKGLADWQALGPFTVQDCVGFGIYLCSSERADAVIRFDTVHRLPSRLSSVERGPRRVGQDGLCESKLGLTQRFAVYVSGDRGDPRSYQLLSDRTAVFQCRRID
jgi:hypothetical protein